MVNTLSLEALIKLMDDPDEDVYEQVKDKLLHFGSEAVPFLENSWEQLDYGQLFQSRMENLIHEIQFESVKSDLEAWIKSPEKDLLRGVCIIARYQFPDLIQAEVEAQIGTIQQTIWLELSNSLTAYEVVKTFNKILFEFYGFSGDTKHFSSPFNSCINSVLESRKGNPLTISVLYSILAQRLSIPIYGVNLPNHFILAYIDEHRAMQTLEPNKPSTGIFFYINAFSKGTLFSKQDIDDFLTKIDKPQRKEYYEPCSNSSIMIRMLNNLIAAYTEQEKHEKVSEIITLRDCF
jgi:regulator of sirC expression with transglutaminase-like and TPR domain